MNEYYLTIDAFMSFWQQVFFISSRLSGAKRARGKKSNNFPARLVKTPVHKIKSTEELIIGLLCLNKGDAWDNTKRNGRKRCQEFVEASGNTENYRDEKHRLVKFVWQCEIQLVHVWQNLTNSKFEVFHIFINLAMFSSISINFTMFFYHDASCNF